MLIGAHVSPAGGPANAVARGVERGCDAIQIFNQNPRAWKPTVYSDEQVADFREAMDKSRVDALLIHAVYLLNAATTDKEMRAKTRASLIASLRAGDALGAHAVVLHPGSALAGKVAPGDQARRQGHRPGAGRERELRAAPREHRRHRRHARALVPGARRPHRRRRRLQAPGPVPGLLPPVRLGLRHPHRGGALAGARRVRRGGRARAPRLAAPQRLPDAAGLQPRPPRRRRRGRARPPRLRGLPLRAALRRIALRAGDTGTRPPWPDQGADHAHAAPAQPGQRAGAVRPRDRAGTQGFAALRPRSNSRAVVHHRAQRKEGDPPPPVQR